jgi:hypothetical protein
VSGVPPPDDELLPHPTSATRSHGAMAMHLELTRLVHCFTRVKSKRSK